MVMPKWMSGAPAAGEAPAFDRRRRVAFAVFGMALALGAVVLALSGRGADAPPPPGTRALAPIPAGYDGRVYESENVRLEFKEPPSTETAQEESP